MAFDAGERNGRYGRIQCQKGKVSSSRGKRKRRVFLLQKDSESQSHPSELSES